MRFDQDFIERVRLANNLVDIISQHVELKKSGGGYLGLCPFHTEKTPSFSVSEEKQVYHCFACKESGNVLTFTQKYQGLTFPEAVEFLAKRAGIPLPEKAQASGDSEKRDLLYRINEFASKFFQSELQKLSDDHEAWKYLKTRGISRDFAKSYKIGYAPEGWTNLTRIFEQKRVPLFQAATLGLVKSRGSGKDGYYDLFRNRIIFPIYSPTEQCLGFGGRVLDQSHPKYLNSPDSPVFHKGQVFYGLNLAAKHIRSKDASVIVEGYTDWLALERAGFHNAVATLGTAFTPNHAQLLSRYSKNAIVLFDGDEAGRLAARRSLAILLSAGLNPRGVLLPYELDPDEFIESQGAAAMKSALDRALPLYDLVLEDEVRSHSGDWAEKVQILDRLRPILGSVPDPRLLALYVESTANFLNIDTNLVRQTLNDLERKRPQAPVLDTQRTASDAPSSKIEVIKPPRAEVELLQVALSREEFLKDVLEAEVIDQISNSGIRQIFKALANAYGQNTCKFDNLSAWLVSRVEPSKYVTGHLEEPIRDLGLDTAKKLLQDCLERVRDSYARSHAKSLLTNLRAAQSDEQKEKLEQFMNIQLKRRQLNHGN